MKIAALADVKARLSAYVDECENEGPVYHAQRQGLGGTAGT
jgi:hypothetical protein